MKIPFPISLTIAFAILYSAAPAAGQPATAGNGYEYMKHAAPSDSPDHLYFARHTAKPVLLRYVAAGGEASSFDAKYCLRISDRVLLSAGCGAYRFGSAGTVNTVNTALCCRTGPVTISAGLRIAPFSPFRDYHPDEYDRDDETGAYLRRTLRDVLNPRIGLECYVPKTAMLFRAGFGYEPSPAKTADNEHDRRVFTAGIGYEFDGGLGIGAGYRRSWWKTMTTNELNGLTVSEDRLYNHLYTSVYLRY